MDDAASEGPPGRKKKLRAVSGGVQTNRDRAFATVFPRCDCTTSMISTHWDHQGLSRFAFPYQPLLVIRTRGRDRGRAGTWLSPVRQSTSRSVGQTHDQVRISRRTSEVVGAVQPRRLRQSRRQTVQTTWQPSPREAAIRTVAIRVPLSCWQ